MTNSGRRFTISLLGAAVCSSCMTWVPQAQAQGAAALNSVAASGKQRMLSQRAVKAYAQLALNVLPEKATLILSTSMTELKVANAALREQAKDTSLVTLQAQAVIIDKLAAVTSTPPTPSSLQQAAQLGEELLANADAVTQVFIKSGAEAPAAMVNLAAKQRMLSQRASSAYFVYQASSKSPELKARMQKAVADFKTTMNAFDDARVEYPQIADRIDTARIQMIFFENAIVVDKPGREQFITVATTSERVLGEMELLTSDIVKQLAPRNAQSTAPQKGR